LRFTVLLVVVVVDAFTIVHFVPVGTFAVTVEVVVAELVLLAFPLGFRALVARLCLADAVPFEVRVIARTVVKVIVAGAAVLAVRV
jgi:hypothetical protein